MDTRNFCKVFNNEVQSELRQQLKISEEKSILEYNEKYINKGELPPVFETERLKDCKINRFPNGEFEIWMNHKFYLPTSSTK